MMGLCRLFQIIFMFILVFAVPSLAQSIGATPEKTVYVTPASPTLVSFGVSQGAGFAERITVDGEYPWLRIEERAFILESRTKKSVEMWVNVTRQGTYVAELKVCAKPAEAEGAFLTTEACTSHTLTVVAEGDSASIRDYLWVGSLCLVLLIALFFIAWRWKRVKDC